MWREHGNVDTLRGADVKESTLFGVNASKVGGMSVKRINFQVPHGIGNTTVLNFPGKLWINAECQSFGDNLDVNAFTGEDSAFISAFSGLTYAFDDTDSVRDGRGMGSGRSQHLGRLPRRQRLSAGGCPRWVSIDLSTPSGYVAHVQLRMLHRGNGCSLTGIAIGG